MANFRLPSGQSLRLSGLGAHTTLDKLKETIHEQINQCECSSDIRILHNGRDLYNDTYPLRNIDDGDVHFTILFRLCGGKGGFGSMLRAMGSQRSGHETDNVEACRDLSGRRIRYVNDEKKIAEWMSKQAERDKVARQRKLDKRERMLAQPKHTFDHHGLAVEITEAASAVDDGVRAGFAKALEHKKRLLDSEHPVVALKKARTSALGGWDVSDSEDSEDSEGGTSQITHASAEAHADTGKHNPATSTTSGNAIGGTSSDTTGSGQSGGQSREQIDNSASAALEERSAVSGETAGDVTEARNGNVLRGKQSTGNGESGGIDASHSTSGANSGGSSDSSPNSLQQGRAATAATVVAEELDLGEYESAAELHVLGLDRIKAALMFLGLKCGGTLEERSLRLFSVKGLQRAEYPKGIIAKPAKKKK